MVRAVRAAAETTGVDLFGLPVASPMQEADYRRAFEIISTERIEALVIQDAAEYLPYRELIVKLVEKAKVPAVYPYRRFAEAGGLITYAIDEPNSIDMPRPKSIRLLGESQFRRYLGIKPGPFN